VTARVGFAIAKKRVSRAVGRNRIRRVARESFRHVRGTLAGVDIVLLANSAADKASNQQLQQSLARHWDNIRNANGDQANVSGRRIQRPREEQK